MRRILFILFLALILVGVAYTLFNLERREGLARNVYESVDRQSALILDFKNPVNFFRNLEENNLIYDEVKDHDLFAELRQAQVFMDSLVRTDRRFELLKSTRLIASATVSEDSLLWTFHLPVLSAYSESEVVDYILKFNPECTAENLFINVPGLGPMYAGVKDRVLILSKRKDDISSRLEGMSAGQGIANQALFSRMLESSGKNKDLNIYLHNAKLRAYTQKFLSGENPFLGDAWTEMDVILKPNTIQLDGLSRGNLTFETGNAFSVSNFFERLPKRIRSFESRSISLDVDSATKTLLDTFEFRHHLKWNTELSEHLEMAYLRAELYPSKSNSAMSFCVLAIQNPLEFEAFLRSFETIDSTSFRGALSFQTVYPSLWKNSLGVDSIGTRFGLVLGESLYFFPDAELRRRLFQELDNAKNLVDDEHFMRFSENFMGKSDYSIYWAPFRSKSFQHPNASDSLQRTLDERIDFLKKLEGISWQYSRERDGSVFHHFFLKYNPSIEEERNTLWEFEMRSRLAMKPQSFVNHYSGASEILVQDSSKTLFLLNNKGKLLWKRKIDGFVLGGIQKVDKYRNQKWQILFNTENKVYLLDRKGRDVEGFPFDYEGGFSAPLNALDYDGNRKYRILIPTRDSLVLNLDLDGKRVKGWNYKRASYAIDDAVQYTQVSKKDFILCHTSKGKFIALNRKGEIRLKFSQEDIRGGQAAWAIQKGKDLRKTFVLAADSSGTIWKLHFKGANAKVGTIPASAKFAVGNIDGDEFFEIFYSDYTGMALMDQNGSISTLLSSGGLSVQLEAGAAPEISTFVNPDGRLLLISEGKVMEYEAELETNQLPLIQDLNADKELEIVLGLGNNLYCFPLPN